jgi:hypothetical protein
MIFPDFSGKFIKLKNLIIKILINFKQIAENRIKIEGSVAKWQQFHSGPLLRATRCNTRLLVFILKFIILHISNDIRKHKHLQIIVYHKHSKKSSFLLHVEANGNFFYGVHVNEYV